MSIQVTESARSQLRYAVSMLQQRSPERADRFIQGVHDLLTERPTIEQTTKPFAGLAGAAVREVEVEGHRLFFRESEGTLWLSGVWSKQT